MGSHPPLALSLVRCHVYCSSCHPCGPPPSLSSQPVCFQDSCYCIAINWVTGTSGFRSTLTILLHGAPSESPSWLTRLYHRLDHYYSRLRVGRSFNLNGRTTWREQN
ncbi:hypothetical protein Pcinc_029136 [Petrolisthes cinctipes]|uniref:Uncharacterized protein n=1 Tax=Petrolisthes cinctipes TaxID=88211 RepID=A0AAE1F1M1_PETCI|nr:hypothetical protein Pcinc_029136 [Petrolisthes cinctipes]